MPTLKSTSSRSRTNKNNNKKTKKGEGKLTSFGCLPCAELVVLLRSINFAAAQPTELPNDVCRRIVDFLIVKAVQPEQVSVTRASSTRSANVLPESVLRNDRTIWSSAENSMPGGRGEEYVQFQLCPAYQTRRIRSCTVRIPRSSPDAVYEFRIDYTPDGTGWKKGTSAMYISQDSNRRRMTFDLQHMDAKEVRFVCLSNLYANFSNYRFRDNGNHSLVALKGVTFG